MLQEHYFKFNLTSYNNKIFNPHMKKHTMLFHMAGYLRNKVKIEKGPFYIHLFQIRLAISIEPNFHIIFLL